MKKLRAAQPTKQIFDPYNGSSSGHQNTESPWKPASFRRGLAVRLNDQLRETALVKSGCHSKPTTTHAPTQQKTIYESLGVAKPSSLPKEKEKRIHFIEAARKGHLTELQMTALEGGPALPESSVTAPHGMFSGLVVHVSGTTVPLISDHSLRSLLVENGAVISPSILRKQVTHVIVSPKTRGGGALAAGKQQREIQTKNNRLKYVTAEWAIDSVTTGKRLSESLYQPAGMKTTRGSVFGAFCVKKPGMLHHASKP